MKKTNTIVALGLLSILIVATGCESRTSTIDPIDSDIAERLPEEQRDIVLDEALAELRSQRFYEERADGITFSSTPGLLQTNELPGQSENIPLFVFEEEVYVQLHAAIDDYFKEMNLQIPDDYLFWNCIDPRMNAIYDDDDKGVAAGYDNENILLWEYESENGYRFVIFVRDSEEGLWRVIHEGTSYKE